MVSHVAYIGEDSAAESQSGPGGSNMEDSAMVPLLLQLLHGTPPM